MNRIARISACLFIWIGVCGLTVRAQIIQLDEIEFLKNKMVIHYDLLDSVEGRFYTIRLYSSSDGFLNALQKVSGAVGLEVKPGKNKTIEWAAADELGSVFEGKLSIEIRGREFIPFINTANINAYKVFKRNRAYNLTWSGGTAQNVLNFDLMNKDKKVMSFPNVANVGHQSFEFPGYVKPGKNYRFRISDSKNKDEQVLTAVFEIKRKVPLFFKAFAGAVIAAGVFVAASKDGSSHDAEIALPITPH